jgi:hypothetical protein
MMCVVDWTALGTCVAAIATVVYAIFTIKLWYQMKDSIRLSNRPYVYANIEELGHDVFFVIHNTGNWAAFNVSIKAEPKISSVQLQFAEQFPIDPFLSQPVIAPHSDLRTWLCDSMYAGMYAKTSNNGSFEITITYQDENGEKYAAAYQLSVGSIVYNHLYTIDKAGDNLEKIAKSLEKLAENK